MKCEQKYRSTSKTNNVMLSLLKLLIFRELIELSISPEFALRQ